MACGCGKNSKQSALKAAQEQKKIEAARRTAADIKTVVAFREELDALDSTSEPTPAK